MTRNKPAFATGACIRALAGCAILLGGRALAGNDLASSDPEDVSRAVAKFAKLAKTEQEQKLGDLLDMLGHADGKKADEAAVALRNLGDHAVPEVARAIRVRRGMPAQRVHMIGILGWAVGHSSGASKTAAIEAVAWALTEEAPVGPAAGEELFKAGADAVPVLTAKVSRGSDPEKLESIRLLARIGAPSVAAVPALLEALKAPGTSDAVKGEAFSVLEKVWAAEMVIPRELCDAIPAAGPVRTRVLVFCSTRKPVNCADGLGAMLPASHPDDQVLILRALGRAGAAAIPLVPAMDRVVAATGSSEVRVEAEKTIGWLLGQAEPAHLPVLAGLLAGGSVSAKKQALLAAGRLGPGSATLVPAIAGLLDAGNPELSTAALASLEAVGTPEAVKAGKAWMAGADIKKNVALLGSADRAEMLGAVQGLAQYGAAANAAVPGLERLFAADDSAAAREDTAALYTALSRTLRAIGTKEALAVLRKYRKAVLFHDAELLDADKLSALKRSLREAKEFGEGTLWKSMEDTDPDYAALNEFEKKRFQASHGKEVLRRQEEIRATTYAAVVPVRFTDRRYSFKEKRFKLDAFGELTWGDSTLVFDRVIQVPPVRASESDAEEWVQSGREVLVTVVFRAPRYFTRPVTGAAAVTGVRGEVIGVRCDIPGQPPSTSYFGKE